MENTLKPEHEIEILECEIKLNEDKIRFYTNAPIYIDLLKRAIDIKNYNDRIADKYKQIAKLKKQIPNATEK
jgi:hypothetical protein